MCARVIVSTGSLNGKYSSATLRFAQLVSYLMPRKKKHAVRSKTQTTNQSLTSSFWRGIGNSNPGRVVRPVRALFL
jgi:hypothetical protein